MLRILFAFVIALHGLIHLMGFIQAFEWAKFEQLTSEISRPKGVLWFMAAILILLAVLSLLFRRNWWWMPAVAGAVLSQVLILLYWQDARAGTIPNLFLLLAAVLGFGGWNFERSVRADLTTFWATEQLSREPISITSFTHLPLPVSKWLWNVGVAGRVPAGRVQLQQTGSMRTSPDAKWMPFTAQQWFRIDKPAFLWSAEVGEGLSLHFNGKDRLIDGKGNMLIKLFGLLPVVDAVGPTIDQGSAVRYLAEMIWFPSAALEDYLHWEAIDEQQARATMITGEDSVSGIFTFNEVGEVIAFEAQRYYDQGGKFSLETWYIDIDAESYREFERIRIPTRSEVIWKLAEGDFRWLQLEITGYKVDEGQQLK